MSSKVSWGTCIVLGCFFAIFTRNLTRNLEMWKKRTIFAPSFTHKLSYKRIGDIMKHIRKSKSRITIDDFVKAMKKANREAEQQMLGPGFHAKDKVHRSKKIYSRKNKHKREDN